MHIDMAFIVFRKMKLKTKQFATVTINSSVNCNKQESIGTPSVCRCKSKSPNRSKNLERYVSAA